MQIQAKSRLWRSVTRGRNIPVQYGEEQCTHTAPTLSCIKPAERSLDVSVSKVEDLYLLAGHSKESMCLC